MKELVSLFSTLGLVAVSFVLLHYLILFLELGDLWALILLVLPLVCTIAYTTNETLPQMWRAAIRIYAWFIALVLSSAALVWFIDLP